MALEAVLGGITRWLRPGNDGGAAAERQPNEPGSPWFGEHVARYRFAQRFAGQGRVLDVACGTGFGLGVLGDTGALVYGADMDRLATDQARAVTAVGRPRVMVMRSHGSRLPLRDGGLDLVTSFETIEHLQHRAAFVAELRRVLRPAGMLLLSTPNVLHTRPIDGRPRNPYHVHEYTPAELEAELRTHFSQVQLLGQMLDGRFRISPFWDDQQRMPRTPGNVTRLWIRRVVHCLPVNMRDPMSRTLWGHDFFPSEHDFHFDVGGIEQAPVLVAICHAGAP